MIWNYKDLRLYYETVGEGIPVLMLHGYELDHRVLSGCMEPVFGSGPCKGRFRRIYLDLPGMGRTKAVPWLENADGLLDILLHFIADMVSEEPFVLIGQSYGGYLAQGVMRALPEQIQGCMLVCPCVLPDQADRTLPKFEITERIDVDRFSREAGYPMFRTSMAVQTPRTWTLFQREVFSALQCKDTAFLEAFRGQGYRLSDPWVRTDGPYPFPALFFTGRQDDCVGYEDAWRFSHAFNHADFLLMNGAGHNLQIDQEEKFQAAAGYWLSKLLLV